MELGRERRGGRADRREGEGASRERGGAEGEEEDGAPSDGDSDDEDASTLSSDEDDGGDDEDAARAANMRAEMLEYIFGRGPSVDRCIAFLDGQAARRRARFDAQAAARRARRDAAAKARAAEKTAKRDKAKKRWGAIKGTVKAASLVGGALAALRAARHGREAAVRRRQPR